ncbi:LirA/MavJ family T4SS effector [Paraburkholderia sp. SIMBA_054]|uniref:LirA/MavJ family T4SS effector n=1 Tax=Paraburkholderia TaxID=1822464 RepID=UPI003978F717
MPYPLRIGMTKEQFKQEIMEYYFPDLCKSSTESSYADDYAAIGAFLTRTDEVLHKLIPLENKLRELALENVKQLRASTSSLTKTDFDTKEVTRKILTRALLDVETQAGFSQAKSGLLHDNSVFGEGKRSQVTLTDKGRTTESKRGNAKDVSLPAGVPKIIGNIHPTDFMVLLKHGYMFKDVGAESAHGEFTHRLQWYAIIKARGELNLANKPIDLYKKMWFKSTLGTTNIPTNLKLYMWVALLDNLSSEKQALNLGTIAWTANTFNAPEDMNTALTRKDYRPEAQFKEQDSSNLFVLRKLLAARQGKRALGGYDGGTDTYSKKKLVDGKAKTILAGRHTVGDTNLSDLKHVVVWIESL